MEKTVEKTENIIFNLIEKNPKITAMELQTETGLSRRGVEYQLDKLKKEKKIKRFGADKGGYWKILNKI